MGAVRGGAAGRRWLGAGGDGGLIKVAGRDPASDEELWWLTPGGWSALAAAREPR